MNLQNEPAKQDPLAAAILELVEQLKRPKIPDENVLWTFSDIAEYLKMSSFTVETKVVTRPDFPNPLQPCITSARGQKRWFARDVMEWARRSSSTLPKSRNRR